ncbi:M14 family metallopeptidase [Dokdonella koreensis]|uniref:Carboxypeptidase n=1 Tax=Dokdonella koreensis DS-123 TaxID=1300342 RepID=A0A160DT12_9GAMM|nr:M14 family metallopeptidase [Dokdonella koreensis]ANB17071.1 Putative carboxypeptidase [Dokdonella koreensis DS-123]
MIARLVLGAAAAVASTSLAAGPVDALRTEAEQSGFVRTGRYAETIALCTAFATRYPEAVRCITFGRTPEGRPMQALIASRSGALDAPAAHARRLPVLLVQGGIHAGEIDGKDAGFLALREALDGTAAPGALERLVLVFVPVFNVDGHERFGRWNRPNQRGPEAMGWRTTAQNLNLNRDYAKAEAPEMQALLRLTGEWDPLLSMDLHATNGAQFEHDISVQIEPLHSGDEALQRIGRDLQAAVLDRLREQGSLPLAFYPSFVIEDDPASGFADGVPPPRFSHGYPPLRNRIGILVETHSWKTYPERVRSTRNTIVAVLERTARDGARWLAAAEAADTAAATLGGTPVALDYQAGERSRPIAFRGYAYTRTPSALSGALVTRYDERRPEVWTVPLRDDVQPRLRVTAPRGGYLVPPAEAGWLRAKLDLHGIAYRELDAPHRQAAVEAFRAERADFAPQPVEGRQRLTVEGRWRAEPRDLEAGTLFVPIAQAKARLVMALLEPQAPDAFLAWGWFNRAFERKEYMEAYVAEQVGREMMADPAVAAAFAQKLAQDPDFARDPAARLEFFYRRHASWDERYRLYPVLRTDAPRP